MKKETKIVKESFIFSGAKFQPEFKDEETGMVTQKVMIFTDKRLSQFRMTDSSKTEVSRYSFKIDAGAFIRGLCKARMIPQLRTMSILDENGKPVDENKVDKDVLFNKKYSYHILALNGSKITIAREQIWEEIPDETKPLKNEDDTDKIDVNGEQEYAPKLDEKGNPIKRLIGYGETTIESIDITEDGLEMARYYVFHPKEMV